MNEIHSLKTMIRSRDLAASRRFYAEVLGLEVVEAWSHPADEGFIVRIGGAGAFLEFLAAGPGDAQQSPGAVPDKIELQLKVTSVDDWAERLKGIFAMEGPVTRPWGNRYLWLRDPDGVRVALFQGPAE